MYWIRILLLLRYEMILCFQVYMEDSLGERIWVDRSDCRAFVQNIQTAFNTKIPSSHLLQFTVQSDTPSSAGW